MLNVSTDFSRFSILLFLISHSLYVLKPQISKKDDTIQSLESELKDAKEKQEKAVEEVCGSSVSVAICFNRQH